ncbi:site-specific integrase [Advenella sp. FME57]|uniref:tyrosine-type recombinase/integrase n=1 Tax=Advenella sp. FME57 TaxID=2742604 RepID=UPI00186604B3|nr:site-specific integrase [Advenella sp. FME57]
MTRYPKKGKGARWTLRELNAIPVDWEGDTLSDGGGLSGEVRVNDGSVSVRWRYAFRWETRISWFQCGTWPTVELAEVRERRDLAKRQVHDGINPNEKKQADRIEAKNQTQAILAEERAERERNKTFREMFAAWLDGGVSRQDDNAGLKRGFEKDVLPAIGDKPLRAVTEQDLRAIYRAVLARGTERNPRDRTVVDLSASIRQLFRWAEQRQPWRTLLANGNPALMVDVSKLISDDYTEERDRVLSDEEVRTLDRLIREQSAAYLNAPDRRVAQRAINPRAQCAIWICFATICRIGELLMSRWDHVDLDGRIWTIPRENVKGRGKKKQDHYIYLNDFAIAQFKRLEALTGNTEWCFPARDGENHVDVKSVSKLIGDRQEKFKDRPNGLKGRRNDNTLVIGDEEWTPHDLRRTGATLMQELGVPLDIIDRCQNHVLGGSRVRRHYLKYDYAKEKQEAWQKLGHRINAILRATN